MKTLNLKENKWHGNISTVAQLKKYLVLTKAEEKEITEASKIHPMLISKYYMSLINPKDKADPIKRMMIPSRDEIVHAEGSYDTSGEYENTKIPGLQHKYKQTALILSTNRCAAYCRFCFRKRLVGMANTEILYRFNLAIDYIKKHKEINNVLISGGDSLMLPVDIIAKFLKQISAIKHVDFIRFGTRVPVVFPDRILQDPKLLKLFKKYSVRGRRINIVTHFNHPNEITKKSIAVINKLLDNNVFIFNQMVLMKGVNDRADILTELLTRLIKLEVLPYYIFQCRPVSRVKYHSQISLYRGYKIFETMKQSAKGHIMCKRFKYIMAHRSGKVEMIGMDKKYMYFKYHHAKKARDTGRFFSLKLDKKAGWLDDFK